MFFGSYNEEMFKNGECFFSHFFCHFLFSKLATPVLQRKTLFFYWDTFNPINRFLLFDSTFLLWLLFNKIILIEGLNFSKLYSVWNLRHFSSNLLRFFNFFLLKCFWMLKYYAFLGYINKVIILGFWLLQTII